MFSISSLLNNTLVQWIKDVAILEPDVIYVQCGAKAHIRSTNYSSSAYIVQIWLVISGNLIHNKTKFYILLALTTTSKCVYKPYAYLFCEVVPYRQEYQNNQNNCCPDKCLPPCSNLGHIVQACFFGCSLFKKFLFFRNSLHGWRYKVQKFFVPGRLARRDPKEVPKGHRAEK